MGLGSLSYDEDGKEYRKAIKNEYFALIEEILKSKKSSNAVDSDGNTGLHLAVIENKLEVVKLLIKQPTINLNTRNNEGYTAFYYVIKKGEEMINVMLATGKIKIHQSKGFANFVTNDDGTEEFKFINMSGQDIKILVNSTKSVKSLVKDTLFPLEINTFESESEQGTFPCEENGENFLNACKDRDEELVAKFLKTSKSSVLNYTDSYGYSALHEACNRKLLKVVKILLDHPSINVNIKNNDGDNALYFGIGDEGIARLLLETGKINIEHMKNVQKFVQSANGSYQFEYQKFSQKWLIKMNSSKSLQSIEKIQ